MTAKARTFVLTSLFVLCAGVGIGFLAYAARSANAVAKPGLDELRFMPGDAAMVAFANVGRLMTSGVRTQARNGFGSDGLRRLESETGINPETDIDRAWFGAMPGRPGRPPVPGPSLVIVRGRFDAGTLERAMRDRGARPDDYNGTRIVVRPAHTVGTPPGPGASVRPAAPSLAVAFLQPGLLAVGGVEIVREAIDAGQSGRNVLTNAELISRVRRLEGNSLWAVGRFAALAAPTPFALGIAPQLPPISWFAVSGQADASIKAQFAAETVDEASANTLRDVIRGGIAIGRLQAGSRSELKAVLQSVQLGVAGQTVTVSVDLSPEALDAISNGLQATLVTPASGPSR